MAPTDRTELARIISSEWPFWWDRSERFGGARQKQLAPEGEWFIWVIRTGRGWGKTRSAAEYVRAKIDAGIWRTVNVAGPTWTDVVGTMVRGAERAPGLLGVWPRRQTPALRISQDDPHLTCWNGAKIRLRAAHNAERFRGPQADGGWADEVDSWSPESMTPLDAWALFEMEVRLGSDPRIVVTSTPKPSRIIASLCGRPDAVVTTGATLENRANLAARFIESIYARYAGTRMGRQELEGEILEQVDGAVLTLDMIDAARVAEAPELARVAIGVDPSGSTQHGDEQGIVACARGVDGHGYVLGDYSCHLSPEGWSRRAIEAFDRHEADTVIAESNFGGEMVRSTLRQLRPTLPVKLTHSSRGKAVRAEPILLLYEQGKIHHVGPIPKLEEQLCRFTSSGYEGEGSPDRADASVFALTSLLVKRTVDWSDLYGEESRAQ